MKKLRLIGATLMLALVLSSRHAKGAVKVEAPADDPSKDVVVQDDFETYADGAKPGGKWTAFAGAADGNVVIVTDKEQGKVVKFEKASTTGWGWKPAVAMKFPTIKDGVRVSFKWRLQDDAAAFGVVLRDEGPVAGTKAAELLVGRDGMITLPRGATDTAKVQLPVVVGKWNTMEFSWNASTSTYDLTVTQDGDPVTIPYLASPSKPTKVALFQINSAVSPEHTAIWYIDDVKIEGKRP